MVLIARLFSNDITNKKSKVILFQFRYICAWFDIWNLNITQCLNNNHEIQVQIVVISLCLDCVNPIRTIREISTCLVYTVRDCRPLIRNGNEELHAFINLMTRTTPCLWEPRETIGVHVAHGNPHFIKHLNTGNISRLKTILLILLWDALMADCSFNSFNNRLSVSFMNLVGFFTLFFYFLSLVSKHD